MRYVAILNYLKLKSRITVENKFKGRFNYAKTFKCGRHIAYISSIIN